MMPRQSDHTLSDIRCPIDEVCFAEGMAPTTTTLDVLLASFAASYQKPDDTDAPAKAPSTQKLVKVAKATDGKIAKVDKVEKTAKAPSPAPFMAGKVLPCKGTISARQFFKAMNVAKDRDEKVIAISGFVGFDVSRPIGEQEIAAFNVARRIMRPLKVDVNEPFKGRVAATIAGYVSGMPDANQKQINNLLARERQAVRAMGEALASGGDLADAKIAVEQARVEAIRADLANLR